MEPRKSFNLNEVFEYARLICSKKEICKSEMVQILLKKSIPLDSIDEIINKLTLEKYIDEKRYSRSFIHDKTRINKWGINKIAFLLKQKNISRSIIDECWGEINAEEYKEMVSNELVKKFKTIQTDEPFKVKAKLLQFGQSRGYENNLLYNIIDDLI